jgi:hypothetical protein
MHGHGRRLLRRVFGRLLVDGSWLLGNHRDALLLLLLLRHGLGLLGVVHCCCFCSGGGGLFCFVAMGWDGRGGREENCDCGCFYERTERQFLSWPFCGGCVTLEMPPPDCIGHDSPIDMLCC